jgi:CheY-like chemotaxis protein
LARKILLADDSVTAQNMGRKILVDAGYEVIAVNNGSAALKKIAELKPDLVILDVYMPGYGGLEVCQRLKESPETARIPVLLTVGKLEPFKPEEAQRVRAEGFIVKPFEASELLSTLSKLEDKVVPRAEPSKPGRFARAIAAAEESGRGGAHEAVSPDSSETGWKSRIGFPKKKPEAEQKVAEETPIQSPVNRDLRSVETPLEKAAERMFRNDEPRQRAAETSVDLAALAPAGLPKDVTPEEVAAIAAAVAQMQVVSTSLNDAPQVSDTRVTETPAPEAGIVEARIVEAPSSASLESAPDRTEASLPSSLQSRGDFTSRVEVEAKSETPAENKPAGSKQAEKLDKVAGEVAATQIYRRRKDDVIPEETHDLPVTMAVTAESVIAAAPSRWTAVPVVLEGGEAAISLEQEMQTAHAASAPANSAAVSTVAEPMRVPDGNSFAQAEPIAEASAAISTPQLDPGPEPAAATPASPVSEPAVSEPAVPEPAVSEPALNVAPAEAAPAPVVQSEVQSDVQSEVQSAVQADPQSDAAASTSSFAAAEPTSPPAPSASSWQSEPVASPITVEPTPVEAPVESSRNIEHDEPMPAPVAEVVSSVAQPEVAELAAPGTLKSESRPEAEPAATEAPELTAQPKLESEVVKTTAAAWASWRQNRDTGNGSEVTEPQPKELDPPPAEPPDTAAMAVAAGAEQIVQEVSPPSSDANNVASIVESVLADLRPKLMEEISRKMSKKK